MRETLKTALRIKSDSFNSEIDDLIESCRADLKLCGIQSPELEPDATISDASIKRAMILYAKANFGYDDDSEKYRKCYNNFKVALALAGDYIALEG